MHGQYISTTEIPGKSHWWWDTDSTNDGGCMFDAVIQQIIAQHGHAEGPPPLPKTFVITLFNPSSFEQRGGIQVGLNWQSDS